MSRRSLIAAVCAVIAALPALQAHADGRMVLVARDVTAQTHCHLGNGLPCLPGSIRDLVLVPLSAAQVDHEPSIPSTANNGQRIQLLESSAAVFGGGAAQPVPNSSSCTSHLLYVSENYQPAGGQSVTISQWYYQNSNCTVYAETDNMTGANTWRFDLVYVRNGDTSMKDLDDIPGCNKGPVGGTFQETPFVPDSGPSHPYPYSDWQLSGHSTCSVYEEADVYWYNVGT